MSYREVVKDGCAALVYDDPIADKDSTEEEKKGEAVRELSPSTPHRWIRDIAASLKQPQLVVKQAQNSEEGGRLSLIKISELKYRSHARKLLLQCCGLLLRAAEIVAKKNPTELATLGSSP